MKQRKLYAIANEIRADWTRLYYGAAPYLVAMETLEDMNDKYGADDAPSIVAYFLSNAAAWHGEVARRIKKELNLMLKQSVNVVK